LLILTEHTKLTLSFRGKLHEGGVAENLPLIRVERRPDRVADVAQHDLWGWFRSRAAYAIQILRRYRAAFA
jgi:hypothetical protein